MPSPSQKCSQQKNQKITLNQGLKQFSNLLVEVLNLLCK
ncbi:hypothetical protein AB751O23_AL_00060 [Chlamydiales bacterium SCGC AB-751-O23]|nr:hypothetical protein AB751O23_AL_00060 [Chlamydiales bacterium SCGC AB-751-O23]